MNVTNTIFLDSPVSAQDFIWLATYSNETFLSEYNFDNQQQNSFYDIDKDKLLRFGLIGMGMNMHYEVNGGTFNIAGRMVDFAYRDNDTGNVYHLTGQPVIVYNDIIQFKNAEADFNPVGNSGTAESTITQYNFGYKQTLDIDGVQFNLKAICGVPYGKNIYMNVRLVADKDMNGSLLIRMNGVQQFLYDAPLSIDIGGEINWEVGC